MFLGSGEQFARFDDPEKKNVSGENRNSRGDEPWYFP